jgi:hypothetical protein
MYPLANRAAMPSDRQASIINTAKSRQLPPPLSSVCSGDCTPFSTRRVYVNWREAPRRPVQQARVEPLFQAVHVLADRGLGDLERVGGLGKAAELDHAHENGDI